MTDEQAGQSKAQDVINRTVWAACDSFRGTIDPSIYKEYVLAMLFLKYISDVWQDHYESLAAIYGDNPEVIEDLLKNERFVLPKQANFHTLYQQRNQPGNGSRIDAALALVARENKNKLTNVFQDIQFNSSKLGDEKQKNDILCHLLEDFAKPGANLRPSLVGTLDIIGNAYEFLIRNFASDSGKKAGEFYTPPEISHLIAHLVDPKPGDDICDPTCGSGSLLMKCGKLIQGNYKSLDYRLFGQEAIGSTWAMAKMNMFLHNEDRHRIEWGDTLREPKLLRDPVTLQQFDVVVANPPFSLEKWGHEQLEQDVFGRYKFGAPPPSKADYAFILHMITSMKPETGRMAVVVPAGVLFRSGREGSIRRHLVEENLLEAIIGLPEKLFYGTSIAAVILLFRAKKADTNILFIDAHCDFGPGKAQNQLRPEDIERILHTVRKRESVANFAHLASLQEVVGNDCNLNIPRYILVHEPEIVVNLDQMREERKRLWQEMTELNGQLDAQIQHLIQETEFRHFQGGDRKA
jgi:type I restriction enzyme M protein